MTPFDDNLEEQDGADLSPEREELSSDDISTEIPELDALDPEFAEVSGEEDPDDLSDVVEELVTMEGDEPSLEEEAVREAAENDLAVDEADAEFREPGDSRVLSVGGAEPDENLDPVESPQSNAKADAGDTDAANVALDDVTAAAPDPDKIPGQDENPLMNWFIIHTYSGFENKVAESLRTRAEAFGFAHRLGQILIPTEEVVEMRNGKKVTSKRLLYPGYVLVQMEMDDDLWHQVKNTPRVTQFVGGGGQPVPLTASEVNSILYRQTEAAERPRPKLSYEKNETVRIIDGPFANFQGKIDEINTERNTLRVLVTIFGRSTPVELDFLQVEKMA